jgi:hypothetical protein
LEAFRLYLCLWLDLVVIVPRDYFYPIMMDFDVCWVFSRSRTVAPQIFSMEKAKSWPVFTRGHPLCIGSSNHTITCLVTCASK